MMGNVGQLSLLNMPDPSKIPALAEPWFLTFNADVQFRIAMTPEDLKEAVWKSLARIGLETQRRT